MALPSLAMTSVGDVQRNNRVGEAGHGWWKDRSANRSRWEPSSQIDPPGRITISLKTPTYRTCASRTRDASSGAIPSR